MTSHFRRFPSSLFLTVKIWRRDSVTSILLIWVRSGSEKMSGRRSWRSWMIYVQRYLLSEDEEIEWPSTRSNDIYIYIYISDSGAGWHDDVKWRYSSKIRWREAYLWKNWITILFLLHYICCIEEIRKRQRLIHDFVANILITTIDVEWSDKFPVRNDKQVRWTWYSHVRQSTLTTTSTSSSKSISEAKRKDRFNTKIDI